MPSPAARRAPSRPNKSGGVVYRELLNVNLAEPAAIAAVCRGMRVITETDRHKHTKGLSAIPLYNHTHKHTNVVFLMTNRLKRCFHVAPTWMPLMGFASHYPSLPLPCFLLIFSFILFPLPSIPLSPFPPFFPIFSHFGSAKTSLLLNFIMKPCSAPTALVASKHTHTHMHTHMDLHADTIASSPSELGNQSNNHRAETSIETGIPLCAKTKEIEQMEEIPGRASWDQSRRLAVYNR